jgi:hypothetical protein
MSLKGGKSKKVNPALTSWVAFVKKVQKEEGISYREAMMSAKKRKDKGEKWMKGGANPYDALTIETSSSEISTGSTGSTGSTMGGGGEYPTPAPVTADFQTALPPPPPATTTASLMGQATTVTTTPITGGRKRKTARKGKKAKKTTRQSRSSRRRK